MLKKPWEAILQRILELTGLHLLFASIFLAIPLWVSLSKFLREVDLNYYQAEIYIASAILFPLLLLLFAYFILSKIRTPFMGVLWDKHGNPYCGHHKILLSNSHPKQWKNLLQAASCHSCPKCPEQIFLMEGLQYMTREDAFQSLQRSKQKNDPTRRSSPT